MACPGPGTIHLQTPSCRAGKGGELVPGVWVSYWPPVHSLEVREEALCRLASPGDPRWGRVSSARPLTVLRRRTARAGACTAPQQPAPRGRSRRNPGPGSRHGWSPSSLLLGGQTLSGSRGKQNTGKLSWCPHNTHASSTLYRAWKQTFALQAAQGG